MSSSTYNYPVKSDGLRPPLTGPLGSKMSAGLGIVIFTLFAVSPFGIACLLVIFPFILRLLQSAPMNGPIATIKGLLVVLCGTLYAQFCVLSFYWWVPKIEFIYFPLSLMLSLAFVFFGGAVAAHTFEPTQSMNSKIVAIISSLIFLPIFGIQSSLNLFSWVTFASVPLAAYIGGLWHQKYYLTHPSSGTR